MSVGVREPVRVRSSVAQWLTLVAVLGLGAMLAFLIAFMFELPQALDPGDGGEQAAKEVVCVPYVNGVLQLAKQGYSAQQIQSVYLLAGAAPEGADWPADRPASYAIKLCGSPAAVIAASK